MAGNTTSLIIQAIDQASGIFKSIGSNSQNMGNDISKSMEDSSKSLLKAQTAAIGLKDTVVGSIGSFKGLVANAGMIGIGATIINSAKNWSLAVYELKRAIGSTSEEASSLLAIGKYAGIGTEEAAGYFAKFGKSISKAKDEMQKAEAEGKQSSDIFSRLGISFDQLNGKNSAQIFATVAEKMRNMADGADKDRVAMELFGKAGFKVTEMMNLSADQIDAINKKAQEMGLIVNDETTEGWKNLDREMNAALGTFGKLAISIGNDMLPALQAKVGALKEMTDAYGKLSPEMRQMIGLTVEGTGELGLFLIGARTVAAFMPYLGAALLSPWTAVIATIGIAIMKLNNYMVGKHRVDSYDKKADVEWSDVNQEYLVRYYDENLGGYNMRPMTDDEKAAQEKYKQTGERPAPEKPEIPEIPRTVLASPPVIGGTGGAGSSGAADKAERKLEEQTRKAADLMASLEQKITEQQGSAHEISMAKLSTEVTKWHGELQKMAEAGVDTGGLAAKIEEYQTVFAEKIKEKWRDAWTDVKNQTALIGAEIVGDKKAQADAEYQITVKRIDDERKKREKELQVDRKDTEAAQMAQAEADAKTLLAKQQRDQKYRDVDAAAYQRQIGYADMSVTLEGKTQDQIDTVKQAAIDKERARLEAALQDKKLDDEKRYALTKQLCELETQQHVIASHNMVTAGTEAIRQIKEKYTDYSSIIVGTYDEINRTAEDNWVKMLSGEQGFAASTKNIFSALTTDILNMFAKIAYQQTVMKPLSDWFTGIVGNWIGGGSNSSAVNAWSAANGGQQPTFENGGLGVTGIGTGGKIPGRAKGGRGQGLTVVGEEGIELINFDNPGMVYSNSQTKDILSGGGAPKEAKVTVNITNNSDTKVKASQRATFDSETQTTIVSIVIDALERNVGGMRDAFQGGAG